MKPEAFLPVHSSSFFLFQLNSAQIEYALSGLDRHKDTIDIANYLIKIASSPLSILLTMFNNSIESKIVPDTFMISKVTPVFRASVLTDPGNYHPIVVLSPFAKILERLVYKYQLNHFLEKEKILFKHQFCFKKNNSTEQAILELTDNLNMTIDSSETKCSIFRPFKSL